MRVGHLLWDLKCGVALREAAGIDSRIRKAANRDGLGQSTVV